MNIKTILLISSAFSLLTLVILISQRQLSFLINVYLALAIFVFGMVFSSDFVAREFQRDSLRKEGMRRISDIGYAEERGILRAKHEYEQSQKPYTPGMGIFGSSSLANMFMRKK